MNPGAKTRNITYLIIMCVVALLPLILGEAWTVLVIEMFIMAIAASAANLMTGYGGMVSFGVAGFYGIGAYITALLITKAGVPFSVAFLAGPVGGTLLAIPIGWFCVRRTAIYFSMLSLAFSQLLYVVIYTWYGFTGGDDGIVGIPIPDFLTSISSYYYFSLAVMVLCLGAMWTVVNSPFGKAIQAMRENMERSDFIGINVRRYQLAVFILSSFFLSLAGTLYCGLNKNVFADYLFWTKTFEIIIVYLLGGIYNFMGPTIGAVIYILTNKIITKYTEYWPITLGLIIVLITLFMPNGLGSFFADLLSAFRADREESR